MSFTRPVGEVFEHKGRKLMVVVSDQCKGCHFDSDDRSVSCSPYGKIMGFCCSMIRDDHQDVIFVPVEEEKKEEEPPTAGDPDRVPAEEEKPAITEEFITDVIFGLESHATKYHIDLIIEHYTASLKNIADVESGCLIDKVVGSRDCFADFINFLWLNENNFRKFYTEEEICRSPILNLIWK